MMPRNSNTPRTKWIVLLLLPSLLLALGTTFVRARGTAADQPKAAIPAQARIEVGQNIPVSGSHSTWAYDEVMMSMDPTNPRRGIACSIVLIPEKAKRVTVAYVTADGGTNWKPTMLTDETAESSDPVCYFGPDSTAHFSARALGLGAQIKTSVCAFAPSASGLSFSDHCSGVQPGTVHIDDATASLRSARQCCKPLRQRH